MVIVDTIYLNEGEIVVDEQIFNDLLEQNKKFKEAVLELESRFKFLLDNKELEFNDYVWYISQIKEIFGDFTKDTNNTSKENNK